MMQIKKLTLFDKTNPKQMLLNIAFLLFICSLFYKLMEQLFSPYGYESWQVSEFLINYQAGFVRRGLLGEILFFFTRHFHINLEWTIKLICLISLGVVCFFFVKLFLKKNYSLYILPLCFFLGGDILGDYWIRKDYLFFCFFIPILWIYAKEKFPLIIKVSIINMLAIFIILTHEVFVFFAFPILLLLFFNQYKSRWGLRAFVLSLLSLLPSICAFFLTVLFHGTHEIAQTIWESWVPILNLDPLTIVNSVSAIGIPSAKIFGWHFQSNIFCEDHRIISLVIWAITFPVVYFIASNALLVFRKQEKDFTRQHKTVLSSVLIFQWFCLLPVFAILSVDYIRVFFYWIAGSFAIFLLIPINTITKLFPSFFIHFVERVNKFLTSILTPSKAALVFLILFTGISFFFFEIERFYLSTMLYNILFIISKPFIILKDFLL
jgi:hypothetical protein